MALVLNDYIRDSVVVNFIVEHFNVMLKDIPNETHVAKVFKPPSSSRIITIENMNAILKLRKTCPHYIFVAERHKMEPALQGKVYSGSLKLSTSDPNWNVCVIGAHRIVVLNTNVECTLRHSMLEVRDLKAILQIMLWNSENNDKLLKQIQEEEECVVCMEYKRESMVFCRYCTAVYCVSCCRSLCSAAQSNDKAKAKAKSKNKSKSKNNKQSRMNIKCTVCNECTEITVQGDKCIRYHVSIMAKLWLKEAALLHALQTKHDIDIVAAVTKPRFDRYKFLNMLLERVPVKILHEFVITTSAPAWIHMLKAADDFREYTA